MSTDADALKAKATIFAILDRQKLKSKIASLSTGTKKPNEEDSTAAAEPVK